MKKEKGLIKISNTNQEEDILMAFILMEQNIQIIKKN
jgi:hypothetical protein